MELKFVIIQNEVILQCIVKPSLLGKYDKYIKTVFRLEKFTYLLLEKHSLPPYYCGSRSSSTLLNSRQSLVT